MATKKTAPKVSKRSKTAKPKEKTGAVKAAGESPPSGPAASDETPEALDARYTWEVLASLLAPPTGEEVTLWALETSPSELASIGKQLRSERVLVDARRHLGQLASWLQDCEKQRKQVPPGFAMGYLRVAFAEALSLRDKLNAKNSTTQKRKEGAAAQSALESVAWREAADLRELLYRGLGVCVAGDSVLTATLEAAYGTIATEDNLATALDRLGALVRSSAKETSAKFVRRLAAAGFDENTAKLAAARATALREVSEKSKGARKAPAVSQTDLDQLDGALLQRMHHWMQLADAARVTHPDVPHVFPITTASYFRRGDRAKTAADTPKNSPDPTKPPA